MFWVFFFHQVRQILGDFAVLIAIVLMVGLDLAIGIGTPKLLVPEKFEVTTIPILDEVMITK